MIILISGVILFALNNKDLIKKSIHLLKQDRTMLGENSENNSKNTSNETVGATAVDTSKWDMTRVNAVADTEGVYVPVPKGFVASGATGEHTVNTGFVIYEGDEPVDDTNAWDESCTRNQFVWVPVPDTTRVFEDIGTTGMKKAKLWNFTSTGRTQIENTDTVYRSEPGILSDTNYDNRQKFTRYGMQGYTREKLYQELLTSFDSDMETIEKYGGFYIGRYETGNITLEQPVVQRMNTNLEGQNWYAMYPRMKNISTNENVEISMIWGCLWDETLQWLVDSGNKTYAKIVRSEDWGNHKNSTFIYTNIYGETSTKSKRNGVMIPTGSSEHCVANNIYDLAGNVYEWTLEASPYSHRVVRSGTYNLGTSDWNMADHSAAYPYASGNIYGSFGVRSCCFIK